VAADGTVTVSVVFLATPPAPPAGTWHLHTVDTDATGITAETPGADFITPGTYLTNALFLGVSSWAAAGFKVSGGNLTLDKTSAGSQRLDFTVSGDTAQGWRLEHTVTEGLRVLEAVPKGGGGTPTVVLDLGAPGFPVAPVTVHRPLYVESAETPGGTNALRVVSTDTIGPGSSMETNRTATLTLNASGVGGTPLVLVPRNNGFGGGAALGSMLIGNDAASNLEFKDNNAVTRVAWATKTGQSLASSYSATAVNNFAGATAYSLNYTFVSGQRYLIRMRARVGRHTGSTRDANFLATVGGVSLAFTNNTVSLFQAGAAGQIEATWSDEAVFTAGVSGTLAVQFTVSPVNGAGNLNMNWRGIVVLGHFDP
jgi:hypothetical protein